MMSTATLIPLAPDRGRSLGTPCFRFATGTYTMTCHGHQAVVRAPAQHPEQLLDEVSSALAAQRRRGHPHPVVVGVVPFDVRRPTHLVTPELTAWDVGDRPSHHFPSKAWSRRAWVEDSSRPMYRAAVAEAIALLRTGALDKIVLARTMDLLFHRQPDVDLFWQYLRTADPHAFTYVIRLGDGSGGQDSTHVLGASPELVVSIQDTRVRTHPLAGSAPRSRAGAQDRATADALERSAKDLVEHRVVVDQVAARLDRLTTELDVPPAPRATATATARMWHLGTEITGSLRPEVGSLAAALALHPTAAVCGRPTAAAQAHIDRLVPTSHGWYAGLVGWADDHRTGRPRLNSDYSAVFTVGGHAKLFLVGHNHHNHGISSTLLWNAAARASETCQTIRDALRAQNKTAGSTVGRDCRISESA